MAVNKILSGRFDQCNRVINEGGPFVLGRLICSAEFKFLHWKTGPFENEDVRSDVLDWI